MCPVPGLALREAMDHCCPAHSVRALRQDEGVVVPLERGHAPVPLALPRVHRVFSVPGLEEGAVFVGGDTVETQDCEAMRLVEKKRIRTATEGHYLLFMQDSISEGTIPRSLLRHL
jgi:hypothetical protein